MKKIFSMQKMMIILISLVFSVSCINLGIFPTPQPKPLSKWITKWLTNPTCKPPCWENLIPGETAILDSPQLLSQVEGVRITVYPSKNQEPPYTQLQWNFSNPGESGAADTYEGGLKISIIWLGLSNDQQLLLEQVVSSYGLPSDVLLYDCRGEITQHSCVVHLIYNNIGIALELFLPDVGKNDHQVRIREDSRVGAIWFFPLGDTSYGEVLGKNTGDFPKGMVQWNGYGDYPR
jgi:hypothetical protein